MAGATGSLHFGDGRFELQPHERRLLVDGVPATLGARAFDLLLELLRQPGVLRTKNELLEAVWTGVVVEEGNLTMQVSTLRKIVGGEIIATIPGRGYRLTARVHGGDGAGNSAPGAPEPPAAPPAPEAPKLQTNLPATLPQLVGRTEDIAALGELIGQHRLVSIVGAGGMGKTTLALHLTANRQADYAHGVCWVELATVTDAEALPAAIAAAIGVGIGSGDPLKGLCGALASLTMLLALDNAEQVVDGVARLAQAVLDKAPGVRFVVTTQAPLKLASEMVYRIGPLTVPQGPLPAAQALGFSAVALFAERARMADARFVLTDANAPAVIELCRQLDGLALAIELAAARAPMLGVQRLAASMGDRLKVLTRSRNRMAPARQQTLRAALEWSHSFLEDRERAVFRRLAVFAGSASLPLVLQVVPDPPGEGDLDEWAVLDALAVLVDRSLVLALTPDEAAEPRYRLLDSPRLFASEQLQLAGEEAALRQRHAQAVAALCDAAWDLYMSGTVRIDTWQQAMTAELDNAREALAWARAADDADAVVRIAATIARIVGSGGYRERVALAQAIEPLIDRIAGTDLLARVCMLLNGAFGTHQRERAVLLVRRCLARMAALSATDAAPARWPWHLALSSLANVESRSGNLPAAEAALAQARALADPAWPSARAFWLLESESFVAQARGDMAACLDWTRRFVAMTVAAGQPERLMMTNLIDVELSTGNAAQASQTGAALVAQLAGGRDEFTLTCARLNLSAALLALGEPGQARPHLRAGWQQAAVFDMQPFIADYLALLAAIERRPEAAARLAGYADAGNARVGEREPNEAAAHVRAVQLARAALGDAAFGRLHAEGTALRDAEVDGIAFAATDEA